MTTSEDAAKSSKDEDKSLIGTMKTRMVEVKRVVSRWWSWSTAAMLAKLKELGSVTYTELVWKNVDKRKREYEDMCKRAKRGIRKRANGTYELPEFGMTDCPKLSCCLRALPTGKLACSLFVATSTWALACWRFSPAWLVLLFFMTTGLDLHYVWRKILDQTMRLSYQDATDPAYVLNPELETVEWCNTFVRGLWDKSLKPFVREDLKAFVNRLLTKWAARHHKHYLQRHLRPEIVELEVGTMIPQVTWLKTDSSEIDLLNSNDYSMTVDVGLRLHLKPSVLIALNAHLSFGIHELKCNVPVRLRLAPLLRDRTLFGQLQISFLGLPNLDFDVSGCFGFLGLPLVKPAVLYAATQLFRYALHPHKIVLPNPWVEDSDRHSLRITRPAGLIRVNLKEGANLMSKGLPTACDPTTQSDPYVVFSVGGTAVKTPVIRGNRNPSWNFVYEFPVSHVDVKYCELRLHVSDFHKGFWQSYDQIGFTTISVKEMKKRCHMGAWYSLADGHSTLHLDLQFVPLACREENLMVAKPSTVSADPRVSQAILVILLHKVDVNIPEPIHPMVVFELSGRTNAKSSVGPLSGNWEYAEEFFFPVHNVCTDKMTISVVDHDSTKTPIRTMSNKCRHTLVDLNTEESESVQEYQRDRHRLLAEKTIDLGDGGFTGFMQGVNLNSTEGDGVYSVILVGKLHLLRSEAYAKKKD